MSFLVRVRTDSAAITRPRLAYACSESKINFNIFNSNIEGLISVRTLSRACRATSGRRARDRRATGPRQRTTGGRQARAVLAEGGNALLGHHTISTVPQRGQGELPRRRGKSVEPRLLYTVSPESVYSSIRYCVLLYV